MKTLKLSGQPTRSIWNGDKANGQWSLGICLDTNRECAVFARNYGSPTGLGNRLDLRIFRTMSNRSGQTFSQDEK